ncbi:MAG: YafY family protein [Burkholderiales bacterium]|nr:YafY family protein [Burkholderiales bacterium]
MRRADRHFQIVQILRSRRLTTARHLADRLEVSERTIYRDIRDLSISGVPVMGEAGVGYALKKGYDLPPIMFGFDEIEALVVGARMAAAWGSKPLAKAANDALEKIAAVLPEPKRGVMETTRIFAPDYAMTDAMADTFEVIRLAVRQRRVVEFNYRDGAGSETARAIRPLGLYFIGQGWMLASWCELRKDFRNFRLDRIANIRTTERSYKEEAGKTLDDFIAIEEAKYANWQAEQGCAPAEASRAKTKQR